MKPKNFPGRKVRRQIDAQKRQAGTASKPYTAEELARMETARAVRSKHRQPSP